MDIVRCNVIIHLLNVNSSVQHALAAIQWSYASSKWLLTACPAIFVIAIRRDAANGESYAEEQHQARHFPTRGVARCQGQPNNSTPRASETLCSS